MISGYGSIITNIIFTLLSIPLALYYLDKEHFGLWALASQINGYLILVDAGMNSAVSRFIADYKDDVNNGDYGSHLMTGGMVFVVQGLIIIALGFVLSCFAPMLFGVPSQLSNNFRTILILLAFCTGFSVACRAISSPLWAFQRNDVLSNVSSISIIMNLVTLWFCFKNNVGVISFAIAQLPMLIVLPIFYGWICCRNNYYPTTGNWGKPSLLIFIRTFKYGKDALIINFGSQLINATQIIIISRSISLDAAAMFAVSTKIYSMGMALTANPISVAAPGLTELYVRGEITSFVKRYWQIISVTLAASTLVAITLAAGNRSFVALWTHGKIQWPWINDLILALLIVLRNINGCFLNIFGITKDWRPVRYVYIFEGLIFVCIGIIFCKYYGITGILIASLIAHLIGTTTFSGRAASRIIGSLSRIGKGVIVSLTLVLIASIINLCGLKFSVMPIAMLTVTSIFSVFAIFIIWNGILPENFRIETWVRLLNIFNSFKKSLISLKTI